MVVLWIFKQQKYFVLSNLKSSVCSHVGLLFHQWTEEKDWEQVKFCENKQGWLFALEPLGALLVVCPFHLLFFVQLTKSTQNKHHHNKYFKHKNEIIQEKNRQINMPDCVTYGLCALGQNVIRLLSFVSDFSFFHRQCQRMPRELATSLITFSSVTQIASQKNWFTNFCLVPFLTC